MIQEEKRRNKHQLRCSHDNCSCPWLAIENNSIVIASKHHGQTHINQITVDELLELLGAKRAG